MFVSFSGGGGDLFHVSTTLSKKITSKPTKKQHFLSLKKLTH